MPEKGWKSVSLPEGLVSAVETIVDKNPAYTSISEFVRAAITRLLKEVESEVATPSIDRSIAEG